MDGSTLFDRVIELSKELDIPLKQLASKAGYNSWYFVRYYNSGSFPLASAAPIARVFDKIPVVIYRESDGGVEDLGIEGFLYGEPVDKYIGRVLKISREKLELSPNEVCERLDTMSDVDIAGISPNDLSSYENGRYLPKNSKFDLLCQLYGLIADYLVQKKQVIPALAEKPSS